MKTDTDDITRTLDDVRNEQQRKLAILTTRLGLDPVVVRVVEEARKPRRCRRRDQTDPLVRLEIVPGGRRAAPRDRQSAVVCVETGDLFPTLQAAGESVGRSAGNISQALSTGGTCGGKRWRQATAAEIALAERTGVAATGRRATERKR